MGKKYIGEFKNGIRHGYGTTFFTRGDVYVGEYNNGKRHGLGVFEWENGNRFIGYFKNGKEDGYALKFEKSWGGKSRMLLSNWKNGKLESGSVEDVGNKTGCLKGKCNNGSDNGIYVSQNRLVLGNTNKSIILMKKYSRELGYQSSTLVKCLFGRCSWQSFRKRASQ